MEKTYFNIKLKEIRTFTWYDAEGTHKYDMYYNV